jgi:hypothetical protein
MSLFATEQRARQIQAELRGLPLDRPATVQDLIEVYEAIACLANEVNTTFLNHRGTDPRLYVPSNR